MPIMCPSLFQGQNCNFGSSQSMDFFFENRFSFQSWTWPGGLDDAWGQGDRTEDNYKKFMRQRCWTGKGPWRSLSLAFYLCSCLLKGETQR